MEGPRNADIIKLFFILVLTIAYVAIAESKSLNKEEAICSKCSEQDTNRHKRDVSDILGSVKGLVTGILDSTWGHIERVQKIPKEENIVYGGGNHNENTFVLDYEYEYQ